MVVVIRDCYDDDNDDNNDEDEEKDDDAAADEDNDDVITLWHKTILKRIPWAFSTYFWNNSVPLQSSGIGRTIWRNFCVRGCFDDDDKTLIRWCRLWAQARNTT